MIRNSYSLNNKSKQTTQLKKLAEELNGHFSKETYKQPTGTWKDAPHH